MQINGEFLLVILIVIGLVGRSNIIATASSLLLILKLISLERFFPALERRGLELGLLFLTMGVLVPFASEKIGPKDVSPLFTSPYGIIALAGGAIATYINGSGLNLLRTEPQMIIGMVIGSIFGIIVFKGIPVGPLMAAGITAFLIQILHLLS
jgi:uncharacterized membrane protein (DUF441 family)